MYEELARGFGVTNIKPLLKSDKANGARMHRESFIGLLEWLAALGNAEGMNEWIADSEAARILAGRLRNDHA